MPKFDLSISPDYLPKWGVWEGVREVVQNGLDEETQHPENKLSLRYWPESNRLEVHNEKAKLPREALLIGKTSKATDQNTIGQFGEGLKLGAMALVRAGCHVKVLNQDELWVASLAEHKQLQAKVLSFDISKSSSSSNGVTVVVSGIDEVQWLDFKGRFLQLSNAKPRHFESVDNGKVLDGDGQKGRLYVKGVLVRSGLSHAYGYDLPKLDINRDRDIVEPYKMAEAISKTWSRVCNRRDSEMNLLPESIVAVEDLVNLCLDPNARDFTSLWGTKGMFSWSVDSAKHAQEAFWKLHPGKMPAHNEAQAAELRHFGKEGVVVPEAGFAFLDGAFGGIQRLMQELESQPKKKYELADLTEQEKDNLLYGIHHSQLAMSKVMMHEPAPISVVDFASPTLDGMFERKLNSDGLGWTVKVFIARRLLSSRSTTLGTLIHEQAHHRGQDGSKEHVSTIESMWEKVHEQLTDAGLTSEPKAA